VNDEFECMQVVVLVDNMPHPEKMLGVEHGLSLYFEVDGSKWLIDTGDSGIFFENAQKLGIEIASIDYLILSHAHRDHTGGLETFVNINHKAKIYLSEKIQNRMFYSLRRGRVRNISPDHVLLEKLANRLVWIRDNTSVTDNVTIVSQIPNKYPIPKANAKLIYTIAGAEYPDDFDHELALAVKLKQGMVVVSGCAHKGVLNILHACTQPFGNTTVLAYIGGTHLLDSSPDEPFETPFEVEQIAREIQHHYPHMHLIAGHCTGNEAKKIFARILGKNYQTFYTGYATNI